MEDRSNQWTGAELRLVFPAAPGGSPPHPGTLLSSRARGFTYIGLLFMVALTGATLGAVGEVWHTSIRREKEAELLFIGNQFRTAIGSYYLGSASVPEFPRSLQDLVEDRRLGTVHRHLRKIYVDPMTGNSEWGLVLAGDRIVGVDSLSAEHAMKTGRFSGADAAFEGTMSYDERTFAFVPAANPAMPGPSTEQPRGASQPQPSISSSPSLAAANAGDKQMDCATQWNRDRAACDGMKGAASGTCDDSADQRFIACVKHDLLPPLAGG